MTNSQGGRNNLYAVSYLNETVQDNLSLEAAIAPNQKQVTVINATYSRGLRYFAIYMDLPQAGARTIRLILAVL